MDTLPAIPPPPALPSLAPVVQVTPHQAWSAAVQNIVAHLCVAGLCFAGKCSIEVALAVICGVSVTDFIGRKALPKIGAGALAFGSTGVLSLLSRLPHVGAAVLAVLTALGIAGCGGLNQGLEATGTALNKAREAYEACQTSAVVLDAVADAYSELADAGVLPADSPEPGHVREIQEQTERSCESARKALNAAKDLYKQANDAAKALQDEDGGVSLLTPDAHPNPLTHWRRADLPTALRYRA